MAEKDPYESNNHRAEVAAYILIVGLAIEFFAAFVFHKGDWTETAVTLVAIAFIVGGVWGEVHFGRKAREAGDKQLVQYEARTAEANERAAEANEKAERERLERLKLEAIVAPRSLSLEQQAVLTDAVRPFAGSKTIIVCPPTDGEALGLALQIRHSLEAAGIPTVDMIGKMLTVGGFAFGIHLAARDTPGNKAFLDALHATLTSFGHPIDADKHSAALPALTYPGADVPEAQLAPMAIFVGTKPVPTMKK